MAATGTGATDDTQEEKTVGAGASPAASALPDQGAWLRLVLLAAVFAVPATLAAVYFVKVSRWLTGILWDRLPAATGLPHEAFLLAIPVLGGLVVGLVITFAPGHGGPDSGASRGMGGRAGTLRELPGTLAASLVSLASGPSLGPEAPLVGIIGTLGGATSSALHLPPEAGRALGIAGLAALFGGLFGNPLASALFILEVTPLAGRQLYRRVMPALVASTVGVYVFNTFDGKPFANFHFPDYPGQEPWHLLVAVAMGIGGAFVGLGYVRLSKVTRRFLARLDSQVVVKAMLGGLVVGLIAIVFGEVTLFSGEAEIQEIIDKGPQMAAITLVGIAAAKMLAAVVSINTGFRGGRVFPVLFIGGTLGMAVHVVFPWIPVALLLATGMAGLGIATFRFPLFLTVVLIPFTSLEVAPFTMLAAIASWVIVDGHDEL